MVVPDGLPVLRCGRLFPALELSTLFIGEGNFLTIHTAALNESFRILTHSLITKLAIGTTPPMVVTSSFLFEDGVGRSV